MALPVAAEATCRGCSDWSIDPFLQPGNQRIDYGSRVETLSQAGIDFAGGHEEYLPGGTHRFTASGISREARAIRF